MNIRELAVCSAVGAGPWLVVSWIYIKGFLPALAYFFCCLLIGLAAGIGGREIIAKR